VLERHDPTNVICHDGKYYVWYTEHPPRDGFVNTNIQLATSEDGYTWAVHGTALDKGGPGAPDEKGALTGYVVPHEGRFYMFYTRVPPGFESSQTSERGIGYAVAETPDGPWTKMAGTILWPGQNSGDDLCGDDANILHREGKWWLVNQRGVTWGFDVARAKPRYVYRFDCNLRV
jgi:sucrose-6-phosphate hydrolase SacC (GH32 family)